MRAWLHGEGDDEEGGAVPLSGFTFNGFIGQIGPGRVGSGTATTV